MKKLIFFALLFSFSTVFAQSDVYGPRPIASQDTCIIVRANPNDRVGKKVCYRKNQVIFLRTSGTTQPNFPPDTHKISTCACQDSLEVWEGPFGLIPDGSEVKDPGGNPVGYAFGNILVEDSQTSETKFLGIPVLNAFPQPLKPSKEVKIVIVDTGVEIDSNIFKSRLPQPVFSGLPAVTKKICNKPGTREGIYGMNTIDPTSIPYYYEPKDKDGHGTFINGILAGMAQDINQHSIQNDPMNIALKQINVKFARSRTANCYLFDGLCGIHYGIQNSAKVINVSWRAESGMAIEKLFKPTLESLYKNDILLVAGAGNDRKDLNNGLKSWPAALSDSAKFGKYSANVITVGAWNIRNNTITNFSNYGESIVNIYAPGDSIVSVGFYDKAFFKFPVVGQGTSYAAPFITRIAGILRGVHPDKKAGEIKNMIINNATRIESISVKSYAGEVRNLIGVRVLDYKKSLNTYSH